MFFRRGKKSARDTWNYFPDVTTAILTTALNRFTFVETSHLLFSAVCKDSLYFFTARTAILNFLMKQELIYFVETTKLWKIFHQQLIPYFSRQGEQLIKLVSGLQVSKHNRERLQQNPGALCGMIATKNGLLCG